MLVCTETVIEQLAGINRRFERLENKLWLTDYPVR